VNLWVWFLQFVEALGAGLGRGVTRGALEVLATPKTATEEKPDEADAIRRRIFAAAVARVQRVQSTPTESNPVIGGNPPPSEPKL
jgi:hypothetical protein